MALKPNSNHVPISAKDYHKQKELGIEPTRHHLQIPAPTRAYYNPKAINDHTLIFESRFESGNLQLAHKVSDFEYNLIL